MALVHVRLFAGLRERAGWAERELDAAATVADIWPALALGDEPDGLLYAANNEHVPLLRTKPPRRVFGLPRRDRHTEGAGSALEEGGLRGRRGVDRPRVVALQPGRPDHMHEPTGAAK